MIVFNIFRFFSRFLWGRLYTTSQLWPIRYEYHKTITNTTILKCFSEIMRHSSLRSHSIKNVTGHSPTTSQSRREAYNMALNIEYWMKKTPRASRVCFFLNKKTKKEVKESKYDTIVWDPRIHRLDPKLCSFVTPVVECVHSWVQGIGQKYEVCTLIVAVLILRFHFKSKVS